MFLLYQKMFFCQKYIVIKMFFEQVIRKDVYKSLCMQDRSEHAEISQAAAALRLAPKTRTPADLQAIDRILAKNRFFQTVPDQARMELCKWSHLRDIEPQVFLGLSNLLCFFANLFLYFCLLGYIVQRR